MRCLPPILIVIVCIMTSGCVPPAEPVRPTAPDAPPTEAVKAEAGVGKQGRSLDGDTGVQQMISGPISTYFKVKEKIAFDLSVKPAIELFKASEGRFPKSHEEFMEKIIKANQIALPALPEGMTYRFHSDVGELWVHPINEGQPGATGSPSTVPPQ